MEECELCGNQMGDVYVVNIEGVDLRTCIKCAKGKKVLSREERPRNDKKKAAEKPKIAEPEIIDNYGGAIRAARESMKIPINVLAEMINEKETLLLRVEQQRTLPTAKLAKKLEKALKIKLEEQPVADTAQRTSNRKEEATLSEFLG